MNDRVKNEMQPIDASELANVEGGLFMLVAGAPAGVATGLALAVGGAVVAAGVVVGAALLIDAAI